MHHHLCPNHNLLYDPPCRCEALRQAELVEALDRNTNARQREELAALSSSALLALPEDVRSFIERVTLHLQSSRSKTPAQMDAMFQEAYRLYCKYQVELGSANAEVSDGGPLTHESTEPRTRRSLH